MIPPRRIVPALAVVFLLAGCTERTTTPRREVSKPIETPAPTPTPVRDPFEAGRRMQSSGPEEIAARLMGAEDANTGSLADRAAIQQAAYRQLAARPEWRDQTMEKLSPDVRPIVRDNVEASAELFKLTEPRDALPDWRIVTPPPAAELRSHYGAAEEQLGVRWTYLAAINLVETRMGRIRGTSTAGAQGPMQFLPSTWARYGQGDINDPRDAIAAAARFLVAHGAPSDMAKALFRYNPSRHYVRAVTLYAGHMERAYEAYYHWQVYVRTTRGDALLHEGWGGSGGEPPIHGAGGSHPGSGGPPEQTAP